MIFFTAFPSRGQTLTGIVRSNGAPVPGVTVKADWLPADRRTDSAGGFRIDAPAAGLHRIVLRAPGYRTTHRTVLFRSGDTTLSVELLPAAELGEVLVTTGTTRATRIRENPVAIQAISSRVLQQTVEPNIMDALVRNTPGLNAVKTGPNISKPFIRGLGYNRVLTLYDGVRQEGQQWGDEHGIEVDAYSIDRAEVIKGPASLMYGSDALAGVVSLMPYAPRSSDSRIHGKAAAEYQSNNHLAGAGLVLYTTRGSWSYGVRSAYRIAGNYRNREDGYVYNTGFRERTASAWANYLKNGRTLSLNATLYDNLQGIPDGSRDSLTGRFTRQTREGAGDSLNGRETVSENELRSYALSPLHQHIQHYRLYARAHLPSGEGGFDLLLGAQRNVRREYSHPTAPQQPGLHVILNTLNYGLSYNFPERNGFQTAIGVNGMGQSNRSAEATDFPIPDYTLADGGAFTHVKWKRKKLVVSGGLRYDLRSLRWEDLYTKTDATSGFSSRAGRDDAGAALPFPAYQKLYSGLSASLGFTYPLSRQVQLKANAGRGYRAPNINEIASNGLDPGAHIVYLGNRSFLPEFSMQEDVGLLFASPSLEGSVSLFHNRVQHYIYLSLKLDGQGAPIVDAQGNRTYQYQQTTATLYGLEASLSWKPLPGLDWSSSFAFVRGIGDIAAEGRSRTDLPLIPPARILSGLGKKCALRNGYAITPRIDAEYNAAQRHYFSLNHTETATPGYALFGAGLVAEHTGTKGRSVQLVLQLSNLLDGVYQSHLSRLKYFEYYSATPGRAGGISGMGRNGCAKLVITF